MEISDSYDHPSKNAILSDIKRCEKIVNYSFPDDLRDLFLRYAGCSPESDTFRIEGWLTPSGDETQAGDETQEDSIDWFLGGKNQSLADFLNDMSSILRPEYVPFAQCGGGDLVCYSLASDSLGSVWYWDHEDMGDEADDEPERAALWSYHKCANSLREFLDGLYQFDDGEIEEETKEYAVDPVDCARWQLYYKTCDALGSFFQSRSQFVEESSDQWTRELSTIYQTFCCGNERIDKKNGVYIRIPCLILRVVLSPKSRFSIWRSAIDKKRFASVLKKLEWHAEYNKGRQRYSESVAFVELSIDSIIAFLNQDLGVEWRERNTPDEIDKALCRFVENLMKNDVVQLTSVFDKYKDDESLYEGYLKGELSSAGVQFSGIPYELYMATWMFKRNDYAEAYRYVDAYIAKYEAMTEKDQKKDEYACYGKFAKYVRDYLATLIESSK